MNFKKSIGMALFTVFSLHAAENPISIKASPPEVAAEAFILEDFQSRSVLAAKDPDKKIDPASLTKMMSIYVVDHELKSGKISLEDEVTISENAWKAEGSRMFVEVGKKIPVKDLINGVVIQSGNDATVALAEYVAGSESSFVDLMNQYAKKLGMTNTHFMNSTGIPHNDHYTTARDLATLSCALIKDFPESYKVYSDKWFTFNGIKQPNRNRLLWREPFIDGIKTGHSSTAGYCLAASGAKDNMRLISIIVGSKSDNERTEDSLQLLRYGFRFYETKRLFEGNTPINTPRIWMGDSKTLPLGLKEDLYITLPQGQYPKLEAKMNINKDITAPVSKGQEQGTLEVKLGETMIAQAPLIALQDVNKGALWDRIADYVSQRFSHLIKVEVKESAQKDS